MFEQIENRTKAIETVVKSLIIYANICNDEEKEDALINIYCFYKKLDIMEKEIEEKKSVLDICSKLIAERKAEIEKFKKDI